QGSVDSSPARRPSGLLWPRARVEFERAPQARHGLRDPGSPGGQGPHHIEAGRRAGADRWIAPPVVRADGGRTPRAEGVRVGRAASQAGVRTMSAPGDLLYRLARRTCSDATIARLIDPWLADLRHEHAEAIAGGHRFRAIGVRVAYGAAFVRLMAS